VARLVEDRAREVHLLTARRRARADAQSLKSSSYRRLCVAAKAATSSSLSA
jgi:hypothetical protein